MSIRNHPSARDLAATEALRLTEAERAAVFEANGMWPEIAETVDQIVAARLAPIEALITGWRGGTGHADSNRFVSIKDLRGALNPPPPPARAPIRTASEGSGRGE